jgi:hypothetical protein
MTNPSNHLVFHGTVVLLFGVLLGAPYGKAINRSAAPQIVNSWRVAHQSLPIAATLMLAVAACLDSLHASVGVQWFIASTLIASNYAFCVSMPIAAITGHRGLTTDGRGMQKLVYLGNIVGACLSLAACVGLVYATGINVLFY